MTSEIIACTSRFLPEVALVPNACPAFEVEQKERGPWSALRCENRRIEQGALQVAQDSVWQLDTSTEGRADDIEDVAIEST